jgi:hypothetical protein
MTLSLLMYAMMVSTFAVVVALLVFDAVRSRSRAAPAPHVATPAQRSVRERVRHRGDCPQPADGTRSGARASVRLPARPRRR